MPWTPPGDPVTSTVITVAYAVANLLSQIRWLRLMTGNADPPGTSYVVVSDSTTGTSWRRILTDAIADGAVTAVKLAAGVAVANLGYTPVNKTGDTMTGALGAQLVRFTGGGQPWWAIPVGNSLFLGIESVVNVIELASTQVKIAATSGAFVNGAEIITTSNDGTLCNAATAVSATTAANASQVGGRTPTATPTANAIPIADGTGKLASGWIPSSVGDAASVTGHVPTATPSPGALPLADASGKLDAWVTPASFSIPSGLGCWVRTASEIPAGFARETALDGLIPIGAGTSFSQTFVEANSYGSTWQHNHGLSAVPVSVTAVTVSGSANGGPSDATGGPTGINGLATAGGVNLPTTGHTHSLNGVSLAVSASGTGSGTATGSTQNQTWLPPLRAVVWARKT